MTSQRMLLSMLAVSLCQLLCLTVAQAQTASKLTVADVEDLFRTELSADDVLGQILSRGLEGALALGPAEAERWQRAGAPEGFHLEVLYKLGHQARVQGEFEMALTYLRKLLESVQVADRRADVMDDIGLIYQAVGNLPEAIRWFNDALQTSPLLYIFFHRGQAYLASGDLQSALKDATTLIDNFPDNFLGFFLRAQLAQRAGDHAAAVESALKAHELSGGHWEPLELLAELASQAGEIDTAIDLQIQAVNAAPSHVRPHLLARLKEYEAGRPVDPEVERRREEQERLAQQRQQQLRGIVELILEGMQEIDDGEFEMGSTLAKDEEPVRTVRVSAFLIGKYEVTRRIYYTIMNAPRLAQEHPELPVESVSYQDCQEFLNRLNAICSQTGCRVTFRLPTEAEWEYAARARTATNDSANLDHEAWFKANAEDRTQPVGQKAANAFGLYDTLGNVWEWCADLYGPYAAEDRQDPQGPRRGRLRVMRGGGRMNTADYVRVSIRGLCPPDETREALGFRLAADLPSQRPSTTADFSRLTLDELSARIETLRQRRAQGDRQHDAELAQLHIARAKMYREAKDYQAALEDYDASIPLAASAGDSATRAYVLAEMAWILATCPDAQIRSGEMAVELAKEACAATGYHEWLPNLALAVAHAELGNFDLAIRRAEAALERSYIETEANQQKSRQVLEALRAGNAWREE